MCSGPATGGRAGILRHAWHGSASANVPLFGTFGKFTMHLSPISALPCIATPALGERRRFALPLTRSFLAASPLQGRGGTSQGTFERASRLWRGGSLLWACGVSLWG